jgi:O-antigen/teichoic acid export membrane protein
VSSQKNIQSKGFKRYFNNTSWLLAENILRIAIALTVGIYVARYLGPGQFGILSYAMSLVGLFSALSTLGLNSILVRKLINKPQKLNELLGTSFSLRIISSLLVFAVLVAIVLLINNDGITNVIILIIAIGLLFQSTDVIRFYFEAKVLSKYYVFSQFVALMTISIVKLIFIYMKLPLVYFASATIAEGAILALGLVIVYSKQQLNIFDWRFSLTEVYGLLKDSWPLILSGVAVSVYTRIDEVMIKQMLGAESVGQYAAARRLSEAWYFVPMIICTSLFPAILNAKKKDEKLYYARLQMLYDLLVWIAVPFALIVTFAASSIVNLTYGEKFAKAGTVLSIHIWAGVSVFLGVASSQYLIAENYTRISFCRTFIGMIFNVILNIILIPKYSINGAAIATLLSYAIATFSIIFFDAVRSDAYRMAKSLLLPVRILVLLGKRLWKICG